MTFAGASFQWVTQLEHNHWVAGSVTIVISIVFENFIDTLKLLAAPAGYFSIRRIKLKKAIFGLFMVIFLFGKDVIVGACARFELFKRHSIRG